MDSFGLIKILRISLLRNVEDKNIKDDFSAKMKSIERSDFFIFKLIIEGK